MNYFVRRTAQAGITVFGVIAFTFALIRFMPGGPMDYVRALMARNNPGAPTDRINKLTEVYSAVAPDEPLYVQFGDYVISVLTGDLGQSFLHKEPVADVLAEALPWTLFVMSLSLVTSFVIALVLGALMGYFEGSRFDSVSTFVSITLNSVPYYVMGIALLLVLGHRLEWFPTGGLYAAREVTAGFNLPFLQSVFYHAALPVASFAITAFGMLALLMRGNCISIIGEDFMRVAELRGLPQRRIALGYLGRNAILPMYTEFMLSIGFMFGGSIILEEIFDYDGVWYRLLQAISARDYSLMMGAFLIITMAVVIGVFIADLTYGFIDPRVTVGDSE